MIPEFLFPEIFPTNSTVFSFPLSPAYLKKINNRMLDRLASQLNTGGDDNQVHIGEDDLDN